MKIKNLSILSFFLFLGFNNLFSQTTYTLDWGTSFAPAWGAPGTSGNCTSIGGSGVNAAVTMVSSGGAGTFVTPYPRVNGAGDFVVAGSTSAVEIDMNFTAQTQVMTSTFTFSQPISGVVMSISDIDKANATSTTYFDSVFITGSDGTNTIIPTITKFNTGSNFTTVSGNTAYANLISGQGGNAASTSTTLAAQQCTVIVNFGTASIKSFTVVYGNASITQADPALQAIAFGNIAFSKTISVSGTIWDDANGSAAGSFTGIQNGTEAGTNAGGTLYANLVETGTGKIIGSVPVTAAGTYSFSGVPQNLNVSVQISTTAGTFGTAAPATGTPANWVNTSPLSQPFNTGTTGANITGKDFGIDKIPVAPSQNYTIITPSFGSFITLNGSGTISSPGPLAGTDAEDGALGSGATFNIVSVAGLNGNKLFYNGVQITGATTITNYNPALLKIQFTGPGSNNLNFTFQSFDAAGFGGSVGTYNINWTGLLPVQNIILTASLSGNNVGVNWTSENEINTNRFVVERSTDNSTFVTVGDIAAAGNYTGIKSYSITNDISALSASKVIYYRIKAIDINGKITYSNMVAVRMFNVKIIKTWPNPVTDNLSVSFFSGYNSNLTLKILDASGAVVFSAGYKIVKGNNQISLTDLKTLSKGIYLMRIDDTTGNISATQKIIKQ
jgi:hypothetical protein